MSDIKIKQPRFTQTNIIIACLFILIIAMGTTITLINFNFQDRRINDEVVRNLTKQVSSSNSEHLNQTQYILNATLAKSNENFLIVLKALNDSNTFIKFLSDNFGEQSNYTQRENAHRTLVEHNQQEGLHNHEQIMAKLNKILNNTQTK